MAYDFDFWDIDAVARPPEPCSVDPGPGAGHGEQADLGHGVVERPRPGVEVPRLPELRELARHQPLGHNHPLERPTSQRSRRQERRDLCIMTGCRRPGPCRRRSSTCAVSASGFGEVEAVSRASTWRRTPARRPPCSAATAPASRRRCGSWPACCPPTEGVALVAGHDLRDRVARRAAGHRLLPRRRRPGAARDPVGAPAARGPAASARRLGGPRARTCSSGSSSATSRTG